MNHSRIVHNDCYTIMCEHFFHCFYLHLEKFLRFLKTKRFFPDYVRNKFGNVCIFDNFTFSIEQWQHRIVQSSFGKVFSCCATNRRTSCLSHCCLLAITDNNKKFKVNKAASDRSRQSEWTIIRYVRVLQLLLIIFTFFDKFIALFLWQFRSLLMYKCKMLFMWNSKYSLTIIIHQLWIWCN